LCRSGASLPFGLLRPPHPQALVLAVLAASLALPATASANDFQTVYREYKRSGTIKPCKFSNGQLRGAERQTPPDVEQYAPSFLDALQSARERSADCGKKAAAAPTPAPTPTTPASAAPTPSTPTPSTQPTTSTPTATTTAPPPAPTVPAQANVKGVASPPIAHAEKEDAAPVAVWLLAALGALAMLFAVFAALAWWFGWSAERITRPWRASWGEFGGRLADFRGEFGEWIRTGH
jgi:hypothetical protein